MDASTEQPKHVVDEVYGFLKVYSDGSVERPEFPGGYQEACPDFVNGVASKDVSINAGTGVWARIFLPQSVSNGNRRIPVVLHYHAGGLCSGTVRAVVFNRFCSKMALLSETIWISVEYRLSPECRLPAAYDDAFSSLMWLHGQSCLQKSQENGYGMQKMAGDACSDVSLDPWLQNADFSKLFIAGESSGGAIVHYLTMRAVRSDIPMLCIRGCLILHAPFIIKDVFPTDFDPSVELQPDTFRRLTLPLGAELDHPYHDPFHADAPSVRDVKLPPLIVVVADQDTLCKPALHYADVMKQFGHKVEVFLTEGQGHCFYLRFPKHTDSDILIRKLVEFIRTHSQDQSAL